MRTQPVKKCKVCDRLVNNGSRKCSHCGFIFFVKPPKVYDCIICGGKCKGKH